MSYPWRPASKPPLSIKLNALTAPFSDVKGTSSSITPAFGIGNGAGCEHSLVVSVAAALNSARPALVARKPSVPAVRYSAVAVGGCFAADSYHCFAVRFGCRLAFAFIA